ncbi:MAG TPA: GNAT family N-acetyltransferase [Kofleriaceae bacterium]|jgi:predicted GNAT family acetyltransferase|nr:GNAT family N-acetyltransferase [Kofleriaceae bacterium]
MTAALERPVWDALHGRHAAFAIGDAHARRFMPEIGSLAGARDDDPDSLAALASLVPLTGTLLLLQAPAIVLPPGTLTVTAAPGVQMVAERAIAAPAEPRVERIERLGAAAGPAMLELAQLTKPGPFGPRTHELGEFWGIRERGALIAMAGERLAHAGFTEVSGVCTHPDARGRGLARLLSAWVASRIAARGETPYLHAYASNTAAIELYRSLGFAVCRAMHVMAIARA